MNQKVKSLASLMRLKNREGEKFVLMLGAGTSMSSNVPSAATLMETLIRDYAPDLAGPGQIEDKFDKLWRRTTNSQRRQFLQPYLDQTPSQGYSRLAELIDAGYFDVALTFNFDDLLEKSLVNAGFHDYKTVIRGETDDGQMQTLVDARSPRFKLVKLHGSLDSSDHFLFDADEMNEYPAPIRALVESMTRNDIIICGYGFADTCVIRSFSKQGGSIVCVNPSGVPRQLRGFLRDRRSDDWSIEGGFDEFFEELHRELLAPAPAAVEEKALRNPFKFLESYEEGDRESFKGRDGEIGDFKAALTASPAPRIILVAGPAKAGKTSLVRAGVMPALESTHAGVYVRCQLDFQKALAPALFPGDATAEGLTVSAALERLVAATPDQRVVLFLDQFDRVTSQFDLTTKSGRAGLSAFFTDQLVAGPANLTLVLVVADDGVLVQQMLQAFNDRGVAWKMVECMAFERKDVAEIIHALALEGGFEFDQQVIDALLQSYDQGRNSTPENRFTLAHIQAVCHILAATRTIDYDSYRSAFDNNLKALHQAINVCDIISFVEDFPWADAVWFRNMIKVPLKESKERIADFIKTHWSELVPQPGMRRRPIPLEAVLPPDDE